MHVISLLFSEKSKLGNYLVSSEYFVHSKIVSLFLLRNTNAQLEYARQLIAGSSKHKQVNYSFCQNISYIQDYLHFLLRNTNPNFEYASSLLVTKKSKLGIIWLFLNIFVVHLKTVAHFLLGNTNAHFEYARWFIAGQSKITAVNFSVLPAYFV